MRGLFRVLPGLLLTLSGCVTQQTTVMESSQQAQASAGAAAAARPVARPNPFAHVPVQCQPPRGSGPYAPTPRPLNNVQITKPARAIANHIAGCASVRFHISADGTPQTIEVLAEYPAGYELGATLAAGIAQLKYPPAGDTAWRFFNVTWLPKE